MLPIRKSVHHRLVGEAENAAASEGLERTDIAYGTFLSRHVSHALEDAYQQREASLDLSEIAASARDWQDTPLTFVSVSLSVPVAIQLDERARTASQQESVEDDKELDDFCLRHIGRSLEAAYEANQPA